MTGLREAVSVVYRLGGPLGFFRGLQARVMYQIPSTAICWSTYEFLKYVLTTTLTQLPASEHQKEEAVSLAASKTPHLELASSSSRASSSSKQSSITCELPITSSHHGVYNAFSLSTVHTSDNVTTNPIIDVRHR